MYLLVARDPTACSGIVVVVVVVVVVSLYSSRSSIKITTVIKLNTCILYYAIYHRMLVRG